MKWLLIEKLIPSDDKFIVNSLNIDDGMKYTPTKDFLEKMYGLLNQKFFGGRLPFDIGFRIEHDLKDKACGHADGEDVNNDGTFRINYISLNGTLMKSVRSWIETIIHEMIHIDDMINHSQHFNGDYNEHGEWFRQQAKRFKKYGFNIGIKDMDRNISTSIDDDDIKTSLEKSVFIAFGKNPVTNVTSMVKVDIKDKESALLKLQKKHCNQVDILITHNLNAARLGDVDIDDIGSLQYNIDSEFDLKYGPFEVVDSIDLKQMRFDESEQHDNGWKSTMTITKLPTGGIHIRT